MNRLRTFIRVHERIRVRVDPEKFVGLMTALVPEVDDQELKMINGDPTKEKPVHMARQIKPERSESRVACTRRGSIGAGRAARSWSAGVSGGAGIGSDDTDCSSCDEKMPIDECPHSQRSCGHHCNHSWDWRCCWCDATFGEYGPTDHGYHGGLHRWGEQVERITHSAILTDVGPRGLPIPASHWTVSQVLFDQSEMPLKKPSGFVTSTGRFVGRREARRIAVAAGQIDDEETYQTYDLFSEDFLPTWSRGSTW